MCGIVLRWRDPLLDLDDDGFLKRALHSLRHRGPDGLGHKQPIPELEIGHHRLAIISPEDGEQPMEDKNTGVVLSFNGEIYNYLELKEELVARGVKFFTTSDTEVLLKAYIEFGDQFISRLNGMFSFVIYDPKKASIYAYRDRLGIKPLYYYFNQKKLVIASEIKAILEDRNIARKLNQERLYEYLVFGFCAGSENLLKDISVLLPGQYMSFSIPKRSLEVMNYWKLWDSRVSLWNENEAVDAIDNALEASVKYRMRADVPFAIILSGGVDSSLVSHYADKMHPGLVAYSLRVKEEKYDETRYAQMVCKDRKLKLNIIDIDSQGVAELLDHVTWLYDEPVLQTNTIGLYKLCLQISTDGIKMLLGGEGADELFGGYGRFQETVSLMRQGMVEKLLLGRNDVAYERIEKFWPGNKPIFPARQKIVDALREHKDVQQVLLNDQFVYLVHLLQRPDRMGMGCGIEMRVPFLDHHLVELANSIDPELRCHPRESKYILKKLASKYLPDELIYRPKLAFDTPIAKSLASGVMNDYFKSHVHQNSSIADLFDMKGIDLLMKNFQLGDVPLWRMLWQLLTLQRWMEIFKVGV